MCVVNAQRRAVELGVPRLGVPRVVALEPMVLLVAGDVAGEAGLIVSVFVGTNLAVQGHNAFEQLGGQSMVGTFVALAGVREMAPIMVASMVAAKTGPSSRTRAMLTTAPRRVSRPISRNAA